MSASGFTKHLSSNNLWGERMSDNVNVTGMNKLPKYAEEGRDAAY